MILKERVFIVGGGPSLYGFNFHRLANHDTIVVNDSVFCTPNPTYFITMDYTWTLKKNVHYGKCVGSRDEAFFAKELQRCFVVGFRGNRLGRTQHGIIDKKKGATYDLRLFDRVIYSSQYGGLGKSFDDFRCGSDSGYSAIQLAVALGYKQIYLLGLDFAVMNTSESIKLGASSTIRSSHGLYGPRGLPNQLVSSIQLKTRTHFHTIAPMGKGNELKVKLDEFLTPYPQMFAEAKVMGLHIISCSSISRLNEYISYEDIGKLV